MDQIQSMRMAARAAAAGGFTTQLRPAGRGASSASLAKRVIGRPA
ncbi:hypothetical protein LJR039_002161 [Pseudorhodoferax sp. LjRoot39]